MLLGRNWTPSQSHVVNGAYWEIDLASEVPLDRRREAYVWATRSAGVGTQWLEDWNLAAGDTLAYVEKKAESLGRLPDEGGTSPDPGQ
jgi:hypothetical protein